MVCEVVYCLFAAGAVWLGFALCSDRGGFWIMCVCVLLVLWLLSVGSLLLFYCPAVLGSFVCGLLCYIVASLLLWVVWVGADFCLGLGLLLL